MTNERQRSTCSACGREILPGVRYCWACPPDSRRKVGDFRADQGQLLWHTDEHAQSSSEVAVAVLLDDQQVEVREVLVGRGADHAMLELVVYTADGTRVESTLHGARLFETLLAGAEMVEATRIA